MKLDVTDCILLGFATGCLILVSKLCFTLGHSETQYKILQSSTLPDMEYQVERHMNDGWSLYGELQVQAYIGANGDMELQIIREVRK